MLAHPYAPASMDRTPILWTLTVFFGATVAFGLIRKLTEDQGTGVAVAAQVVTLAVIVVAIVVVVRRQDQG